MKYIVPIFAILMLALGACAQTQLFVVHQGFHAEGNGPWEYQTSISIDGRTITEWKVKTTLLSEEERNGAKTFGDNFKQDYKGELKKAEKIINDLMHVSPTKSWNGISIGDSILIPRERYYVKDRLDNHFPEAIVIGFVFEKEDVFVRYKAYGSMGANRYYGGEFIERVKLIKKIQKL